MACLNKKKVWVKVKKGWEVCRERKMFFGSVKTGTETLYKTPQNGPKWPYFVHVEQKVGVKFSKTSTLVFGKKISANYCFMGKNVLYLTGLICDEARGCHESG